MVPKLHPRGSSFRGASDYILHDAERATTKERVPWCMTVNLATQDPKWAWHEMVETYWAQDALKSASGIDLRGRKNRKPVLHYSLSWAQSESPSQEDMQKAALSSLAALGLGDHQALIAAHTDTKHPHVHIIVNLIDPTTGRSIDLKFPKLDLSRWAESYEREHGIHCEERIRNNEARRRGADSILMGQDKTAGKVPGVMGREREAADLEARDKARVQLERWRRKRDIRNLGPDKLLGNDPEAAMVGDTPSVHGWAHRRRNGYNAPSKLLRIRTRENAPEGVPIVHKKITPEQYRADNPLRHERNPLHLLARPTRRPDKEVPRVRKHRADNRRVWLEKKDVVDRMKRMRAEAEVLHKIDRNATWERHKIKRDDLWKNTQAALRQANDHFYKVFRPHWRELYSAQRKEVKFVECSTPLERAVFVFSNDRRLGNGKPLKARDKNAAISRPGLLLDLLDRAHERERTRLAQVQKAEASVVTTKVLDDYARRHDALLSRQTDERQAQRLDQFKESRQVTFKDARDSLIDDGAGHVPKKTFKQADDLADGFGSEASGDGQGDQQPYDRAEEIRRDMEAWRKKNRGRDFGREM